MQWATGGRASSYRERGQQPLLFAPRLVCSAMDHDKGSIVNETQLQPRHRPNHFGAWQYSRRPIFHERCAIQKKLSATERASLRTASQLLQHPWML